MYFVRSWVCLFMRNIDHHLIIVFLVIVLLLRLRSGSRCKLTSTKILNVILITSSELFFYSTYATSVCYGSCHSIDLFLGWASEAINVLLLRDNEKNIFVCVCESVVRVRNSNLTLGPALTKFSAKVDWQKIVHDPSG